MFSKMKMVYVSVEEMNKLLKLAKPKFELTQEELEYGRLSFPKCWYHRIDDKITNFHLYINDGWLKDKHKLKCTTRTVHYVCKKDGSEAMEHKTGMEAYCLLQRMTKFQIEMPNYEYIEGYGYHFDGQPIATISGFRYKNHQYIGRRVFAYGYDLNSSYSAAMLKDMPDTSKPYRTGILKQGEIGFNQSIDDQGFYYLKATKEIGEFCEWIFPIMKSPFAHFVEYYYEKKAKATTKQERQYYKDILNFAVGFIRRKNPFIHSAILTYARDRILELVDTNTIYSNTDSIISVTRRYDIEDELGSNVGEFKLEHNNEQFALTESGYQWGNELPSISGKSKQWFANAYPNGFDILRDKLPQNANVWQYNKLTRQLERND